MYQGGRHSCLHELQGAPHALSLPAGEEDNGIGRRRRVHSRPNEETGRGHRDDEECKHEGTGHPADAGSATADGGADGNSVRGRRQPSAPAADPVGRVAHAGPHHEGAEIVRKRLHSPVTMNMVWVPGTLMGDWARRSQSASGSGGSASAPRLESPHRLNRWSSWQNASEAPEAERLGEASDALVLTRRAGAAS